jgi:hypothetical protein
MAPQTGQLSVPAAIVFKKDRRDTFAGCIDIVSCMQLDKSQRATARTRASGGGWPVSMIAKKW